MAFVTHANHKKWKNRVTKVITCLILDRFQQTWYYLIPQSLRNLLIPRLLKLIKIETSYGRCHQCGFQSPGPLIHCLCIEKCLIFLSTI
jgi:hypothetical protein